MGPHNLKHEPCERHPTGRPVSVCPGCGKTVCSECIKLNGYFCSTTCREAARAADPEEEAAEGRVDYVGAQQRYDHIAKILFRRIPLAIAALIALVVLIRWIDSTGEEQWRITLKQSAGIAQMIEVDDTLFVLDDNGAVTAMDTKTGKEKWGRPDENLEPPIVHMDDALFMAGGGHVLCLSAGDGNVRWKHELDEGVYNVLWKAGTAGIVAGATRYTSSDDADESWSKEEMEDEEDVRIYAEIDHLAAYDLKNGRPKWGDRMNSGSATAGSKCCYLRLYISGMGSLIGGDISGRLVARAASDGEVLWRYKSDAELISLTEGNRFLYLESMKILPEMLTKFGGGSPPEISLIAVRKRGFLHRLTHW